MKKYALLGWPVKHSVSPEMQGAGFAELGIDAGYELIEVEPERFAEKVTSLVAAGFSGWNITVPHKGAMMRLADEVEPSARAAQSVNTIINDQGRLRGYSTDGYGLAMSIRNAFGVKLEGNHFLFWGTGGAARATATHFAANGAGSITLVNRTRSKAESLAALIKELNPCCNVQVESPELNDHLKDCLARVSVVIQSTSIGLHADDPISIPEALLSPGLRVMDMIYRQTKLLQIARERGCNVADGTEMLLYQGARSFSLWTGREAPIDAMRAGLMRALRDNSHPKRVTR